MKIELFVGDITAVPAEGVATSTNPMLELMAGTGGALREAGGNVIQEECARQIAEELSLRGRRWLEPGSVRVTSAGSLPYRGIAHCVAIDAFHDSSEAIIAACTEGALRAGQEHGWLTLALPIFATGHGKFDFERSLRAMLGVLRSTPTGPLETVLLVLRSELDHRATASLLVQD